MMKKVLLAVLLSGLSVMQWGCVSTGTFDEMKKKAEDTEKSRQELDKGLKELQEQYRILKGENEKLRGDLDKLTREKVGVEKERDKLAADNRELSAVLNAKKDDFSRTVTEMRQKVADLSAENAGLKADIARQQKLKEEEVQKTSKTYEELLDKMKHEISQGQVTISELKGKLTVNMVDAILFDSGKAEVKPEGLVVLQKVVDILKGIKDKAIRIEGHTDNVQIVGALTRKYPTNWELSAARAINVTRYLQQQGVDATNLNAVAFGEFKPVAPNDTEEGKAKNRRIEIILVPKE